MCGLAGVIADEACDALTVAVQAMGQALEHRGPDDEGVFAEPGVALAHRRLSIIDLSTAGHQPMVSPCGRWVLVYNGELYNFRELRHQLEAKGTAFRGHSDSEVLLASWAQWGEDALARFNGIFAGAIWDRQEHQGYLFRDRFGVKPLFWAQYERGYAFASEITALLQSSRIQRAIDGPALHEYLHYGAALGANTLFRGVRQVLPGYLLRIRAEDHVCKPFYSLSRLPETVVSEDEAVVKTRRLLDEAVKRQLVADVPVGVLLSGGIDSSAITCIAARYLPSLETYSIAFDDAQGELPKARAVARHAGTQHHELRVRARDVPRAVSRLVLAHGQPFGDAADIPLFLVGEQLRGRRKVLLQGDGGDEMFAGYRRYQVLRHAFAWHLAGAAYRVATARCAKPKLPPRWHRFAVLHGEPSRARRLAWLLTQEVASSRPSLFLREDLRPEVEAYDPASRFVELHKGLRDFDATQAMLRLDSMIWLPDVFLAKVDRATMAQSIETRVPFLDNELSDFALGLPSRLKLLGGQKKGLLRRALRGIVPKEILEAPKSGFGVPYRDWVRGPLGNEVRQTVLDSKASRDLLCKASVSALLDGQNGANHRGFMVYKLFQLGLWYNTFF